MSKDNPKKAFQNPIDPDKITENPGLLPYAHTVGGAVIKPEDKGKLKGRSIKAMEQQTDRQMQQLYEQMEVLARQAKSLKHRVEISYKIYQTGLSFEPVVGDTYYFYLRKSGDYMVSMVKPEEWGRGPSVPTYLATVQLLADHTWEVLEYHEGFSFDDETQEADSQQASDRAEAKA